MPGDYNSIIAHAICYGCATNEETEKNHLHGEMVAYGLLILFIVDKQLDELNRWLPIYREIGWPTKLSHMGLDESHTTTNRGKIRFCSRCSCITI